MHNDNASAPSQFSPPDRLMGSVPCGKVHNVHADDQSGIVWVETDTHGMTVEWASDGRLEDLPKPGEPAVHCPSLGIVGFGTGVELRWFFVAHEGWDLAALERNPGDERKRQHELIVLTIALVALAALQVVSALRGICALQTLADVRNMLPQLAIALAIVAGALHWRNAVRGWTVRRVLGVAAKADRV
jgi:hypothetical protein